MGVMISLIGCSMKYYSYPKRAVCLIHSLDVHRQVFDLSHLLANKHSNFMKAHLVHRFKLLVLAGILLPTLALADALQVIIEGLSGDELANVKSSLTINQLLDEARLIDKVRGTEPTPLDPSISQRRLERMHRRAEAEIRTALQPFGLYSPTIKATLTRLDDTWRAIYNITPGKPVLVDKVLISIKTDDTDLKQQLESPNLQVLKKRVQPGERLMHQRYTQTKSQLLETAISSGYLDARFTTSELSIDPSTFSASIILELDTGKQYRFGQLTLEQDILRQDAIGNYIPFDTGDVFDTNQLITLQLALNDSGYFDQVEVTADREAAEKYAIPIIVSAVASRPRQYTLGFGYGTDTGLRAKFGVEFRRINQRGHKLYTDFLLSEVKRSATIQYAVPLGALGANSLRYIAQYEEEDVGDGDGETERYLLGVNHSDTWRGWQRRLYLNYQHENFRFGDDQRSVDFLIPGINLIYTKADNLLLPQRGYSWFIDVHGGTDTLISDTTFLQGRVVGQRVWSPTNRMRILLRAEYGLTSVDEFSQLPTSERFFAGGDRSVRGYAYQSIGPMDKDSNVIGGSHLVTASAEVDYLIYNDVGVALFTDAGDASDSNDFSFNRSFGTGLRWRSPVGMFRLDVARPLHSDESVRLHISVGADL